MNDIIKGLITILNHMNKAFTFLTIIFITGIFLSCSPNRKEKHIQEINRNNSIININLDSEIQYDIVYASSLFENVDITVLETTQEALLGSVDKIEVHDGIILVLDSKISNGVFTFNRSGKFLNQIGRTGGGPGEYVHPSDFTVDHANHIIYVLDRKTHKINSYTFPDGEYKNSIKIENRDIRSHYIMYYNDKLYADAESYADTNNDFMLREIDLKTGEQTSCWLSNQQYNKGYNNRLGNNIFYITKNPFYRSPCSNPKFVQLFMDTIISITKTGLIPFLTVESQNFVTDQDIKFDTNKKTNVVENLIKTNKIYNIHNYLENHNFILLSYVQGVGLRTIMYNKADHTTKKIAGIFDDLTYKIDLEKQETGLIPNFMYSDENGIYGCINPNEMGKFINLIKNNKLNISVEQKISDFNIIEDSNPVILHYRNYSKDTSLQKTLSE
ncbi:MAG: 6-bladed beta-propeller [Dysgonamonadaceae bacterium]|jgi:hypothetical protein|nr:6-bladed beta-propeller [Dysgonamonadaceae bacterium]